MRPPSTSFRDVAARAALWLAIASIACGLAAPAAAKVVEERASPDSPAGSEYAPPLDRARERAGGSPSDGGDGSSAAPFGEGIEPAGAGGGADTAVAPSSEPRAGAVAERPRPGAREARDRPERDVARAGVGGAQDGGPEPWTIALALAVPLVGAGLGLLLRRRTHR